MQDIRAQLLAAFEAEHRDHLAAMRDAFAKAAQGRAYDLKDVFRRAHSLKGAARAVDLPMIEDLAHRLEAVLQRALDEEASLAPGDLRVLEMGLDAIEAGAADVAAGRAPADPATARAALDALLAGEPPAPAAPPAPEPAP
ncbi:MAG TPA: Hpt domain-containing protein, partial [Beijerinckiaceae bacterium]